MEPLRPSDPLHLGQYTLLGVLGSGGMGRVYLGRSEAGEKVAVKVIKGAVISGDDETLKRFAAEAENLRGAYGSRLARFERADLEGRPPWLATEYVPGLTLEQFVVAHGPLKLEFAAAVGAMLVEGLESVHEADLLHRDLKPRNVIMGPDGPRVIDLGLAVLRSREEGLTLSGALVGTPAYMAPEQARGEPMLTPTVDVYALAATLVFALTGATVYPGLDKYDLIDAIRDPDRHPQTGGVPSQLRSLINTMLAREPADRPGLSAVKRRLIDVAQSGGESIGDVRIAVAGFTYVEPEVIEPPAGDGVADPGAGAPDTDENAEAVNASANPGPGRETASDSGENETGSGSVSPRPREPIDLGWLVERLRKDYDRDAPF